MSKLYEVSTDYKKSIEERETWNNPEKPDEAFTLVQGWRSGSVVIKVEDDPNIEKLRENKDGIDMHTFMVIDHSFWDGVFFSIESDDAALKEKIENLWEEDAYCGLEEAGYIQDDTELMFFGPLTVEETK